jgi:ribonucleotide reductase beta subunit family protein with ferritin-like domain
MTRDLMKQHIRHCANMVASYLGYSNLYGETSTPFSFMVNRGGNIKHNMFESMVTAYNSAGSTEDNELRFDDEFD